MMPARPAVAFLVAVLFSAAFVVEDLGIFGLGVSAEATNEPILPSEDCRGNRFCCHTCEDVCLHSHSHSYSHSLSMSILKFNMMLCLIIIFGDMQLFCSDFSNMNRNTGSEKTTPRVCGLKFSRGLTKRGLKSQICLKSASTAIQNSSKVRAAPRSVTPKKSLGKLVIDIATCIDGYSSSSFFPLLGLLRTAWWFFPCKAMLFQGEPLLCSTWDFPIFASGNPGKLSSVGEFGESNWEVTSSWAPQRAVQNAEYDGSRKTAGTESPSLRWNGTC